MREGARCGYYYLYNGLDLYSGVVSFISPPEGFLTSLCFSCLQESPESPLVSSAIPGGQLALVSATILQATQVSDHCIHESPSRPSFQRFGWNPSPCFGEPRGSDFLPWLFPSAPCWVTCFCTVSQGLWMDFFFLVFCAQDR